jgi:hypothetical protein
MANQESCGAIWARTSKAGKPYLSIVFTAADGRKSEFIAFENDKGDNEKRPDYKIFRSEPRNDNSPVGPQGSPTPRTNPPQAPRPQPAYASPPGDDSTIPF